MVAVLELVQIHAFVFHRAPQPLDEDIVHPAPLVVHGVFDPDGLKRARELEARELRPLIGVEDLGPTETRKRLLQRGHSEIRIHRVRQPPAQHTPTVPVHHLEKIHETSMHGIKVISEYLTLSGLSISKPSENRVYLVLHIL